MKGFSASCHGRSMLTANPLKTTTRKEFSLQGTVAAAIAALLVPGMGCDNRHDIGAISGQQANPGSAGSAGSVTGAAGSGGSAGSLAAGTAGASGSGLVGTACACTPGSAVSVLACGQGFPTFAGRDAPEALVSSNGETVVFNRCAPGASGGCTSDLVRWTRAGGATRLASAWAYAVSADGATILADLGDGSTGSSHPVAWRDGNFIDLGLVGADAHLLSADGAVVAARVESSAGVAQAVLHSVVGGAVTMLGDLSGGSEWSQPNAINADGSVIAGYGNTTGGQEPFVWTAASGQMVNLGAIDQVNQTVALATNSDGTVVAGTSLTSSGTAIFRWTPAGGMKAIAYQFVNVPGRSPVHFLWTPPLLVSNAGDVVTGTQVNPSDPTLPAAFRWTSAAGVVALALPNEASILRAASQDGSHLVGARVQTSSRPSQPPSLDDPISYTPFVWDTLHGTRDLVAVLAAAGVDLGGLTLGDPIAMSADGTTVIGHATCGADTVIYRATLSF